MSNKANEKAEAMEASKAREVDVTSILNEMNGKLDSLAKENVELREANKKQQAEHTEIVNGLQNSIKKLQSNPASTDKDKETKAKELRAARAKRVSTKIKGLVIRTAVESDIKPVTKAK